MSSNPDTPLSTVISQALVAYTIELDNEFEHRFAQAGGRARVVSVAMWSNFMRFVGDGITVGDLPAATGTRKPRVLSTLGGMERWRYIAVGPERIREGAMRGARADDERVPRIDPVAAREREQQAGKRRAAPADRRPRGCGQSAPSTGAEADSESARASPSRRNGGWQRR